MIHLNEFEEQVIVPTEDFPVEETPRKVSIPKRVDTIYKYDLFESDVVFRTKCINNALYRFRNYPLTKEDMAKWMYKHLVQENWVAIEEIQANALDVFAYWKEMKLV